MENQNHIGKDALAGVSLRNLDLRGRAIASFVVKDVRLGSPNISAAALAVILEAAAEGLATEAEILRSGRIR